MSSRGSGVQGRVTGKCPVCSGGLPPARMRLYLLRHGIAENGKPGSPDAERALTAEGKRKLKDILRTAKAAGIAPAWIVTSPYRRAVETAEIAASVLGYKEKLCKAQALVPGGDPAEVWNEVRTYKASGEILLVGHQPLFGLLLGHLLNTPQLMVDFKKGALACVDADPASLQPHAVLRWFLAPTLTGEQE